MKPSVKLNLQIAEREAWQMPLLSVGKICPGKSAHGFTMAASVLMRGGSLCVLEGLLVASTNRVELVWPKPYALPATACLMLLPGPAGAPG